MSLLFIDGFDHYSTSEIAQKWPTTAGAPAINATGGRDSTGGLELNANGEYVERALAANEATLIVGARVKVSSLASNTDYVKFLDAGTLQVKIRIRTDGKIEAFRGTTSLGASATAPISAGAFYYLEARAVFHGATGEVQVYVDGTLVLTLTGQDTIDTANAYCNSVRFNCDAALTVTVDDVYFNDATVMGDCRVDTVLANADGSDEDFALSAGVDSYALVDDAAPDGDTTHILSDTLADRTTLNFAAIPSATGLTIYGVQVGMVARKDSAGSRGVGAAVRTGGSEFTGSGQSLTTAYLWYGEVYEENPDTTAPWTEAEINAGEFGVEITS